MAAKLLLQNHLLPLDAVALGRFVVDMKNPQRRYHDAFGAEHLSSTVQVEKDVRELSEHVKNTQVGVALTQLLTLFQSRKKAQGVHVQSTMARTYILNHWDSSFRSACALDDTRRWIEEAIEDGKDIYFIVGYRTFLNASVNVAAEAKKGLGYTIQAPVSSVVEANLYGIRLGGVLDPSVTQENETEEKSAHDFTVSGEAVYAVQYCKMAFKWFSSRKVETGLLGDNKWRVYVGIRGEEEEDAEDNLLEVAFEEQWDTSETLLDECSIAPGA